MEKPSQGGLCSNPRFPVGLGNPKVSEALQTSRRQADIGVRVHRITQRHSPRESRLQESGRAYHHEAGCRGRDGSVKLQPWWIGEAKSRGGERAAEAYSIEWTKRVRAIQTKGLSQSSEARRDAAQSGPRGSITDAL